MKNFFFFLCTLILFFLQISCSNISSHADSNANENSNTEDRDFDKYNIRRENNAIDTLVKKFNTVYERRSSTKTGIIGSFSYTVKDGNGYSSGSYNYSYTYNFYDTGKYTLEYSQNVSNGNGSDGYSVTQDSGTFILTKRENNYYITLKNSKGKETKYRYLLSEKFLVFLNTNNITEYKLALDKTTYEYNSTDDELRSVEHYYRDSGYNGILGKWTMYIGEMWRETGYDFMGNCYENKYWPKILEIEFGEDGLFTLTKQVTSREDNKSVTNFVQGVFGVIENAEKDYQIGLVSMNEKQLLSSYKVSNNYLHFDKSIEEIFTSFQITYTSMYGVTPSAITVEENLKLTEQQLPTLSCNGYKFLGWYIGDERIVADSYLVTKNITLQAKWQQTGYSVSFEPNNGEIMPSLILNSIRECPSVTREDYDFEGWYTDSSFNGKPISFPYSVNSAITLYAKWSKRFNLSFETNSNIIIDSYRTSKIENLEDITQDGYIFAGWYLDNDFNDKARFPLKLETDTKLYARWLSNSEAVLITYETILSFNPNTFTQSFTIIYKGVLYENYLSYLCDKIKLSEQDVTLDLSSATGMKNLSYKTNDTKKKYISYFDECTHLKTLQLPDSLQTIGDYAFYGCTCIDNIIFGYNLTSIGNYAFGKKSLSEKINGTTVIRDYCCKIKTIKIGNSISRIGIGAFNGCTLEEADFSEDSHWLYTSNSKYSNGIPINLSNKENNAEFLSNTYQNYYWYRE